MNKKVAVLVQERGFLPQFIHWSVVRSRFDSVASGESGSSCIQYCFNGFNS